MLSLLSGTVLRRSSWLLLTGILDPLASTELLVEQEEEGDGEEGVVDVSLVVERDGILVLRGRPDGFKRGWPSSLSTGETDLERRLFD